MTHNRNPTLNPNPNLTAGMGDSPKRGNYSLGSEDDTKGSHPDSTKFFSGLGSGQGLGCCVGLGFLGLGLRLRLRLRLKVRAKDKAKA